MGRVKIKRDYEAFLDGYKLALIMATRSKYLSLVEHYPSYRFDEENPWNSLEEEARWMWETYTHPRAIENPAYF